MSIEDILNKIIIPLISGFIGGSIGNIVVENYKSKRKHKMNNKKTFFNNNGDIINGDKW